MRKNILAILLTVSFMMVVIHEMIPHHHHGMDDDIELFSHQQHTNKQGSNSETANHFPFPSHHHVSASEGFDIARIGTGLERNVISPFCFLIPNHLLYIPDAEPPENTFYSDFSVPLSTLPFIISPNAMRGSPCIA